jgi:hypothetical protein
MAVVMHTGCSETDDAGATCERERDHAGAHQAKTATGFTSWSLRGADVTPPLRNAQPTVPDVKA